jgi:hypothetical protein
MDIGREESNMEANKIGLSQSLGALPRLLEDMKAKEALANWNATRGIELNALGAVAGGNANYGVKEMPILQDYNQPNPWTQLVNTGLELIGKQYGESIKKPDTTLEDLKKILETR